MLIDFWASHEMQRQAGRSVLEALSRSHDCAWLGEGDVPRPGARAAVVLGHVSDFPAVRKSRDGYRYLFFLSHDLGETGNGSIYRDFYMRQFDIVFAPGELYAKAAKRDLPSGVRVDICGWPKYDVATLPPEAAALVSRLEAARARGPVVIYAASRPQNAGWREILPVLLDSGATVVVKNHVHFGAAELEAFRAAGTKPIELSESEAMEAMAGARPDAIVAPRELNLCALFPFADVLVSDNSSCLIEFLPFGPSIETDPAGEMSAGFPEIVHAPAARLAELAGSAAAIKALLAAKPRGKGSATIFRPDGEGAGKLAARLIEGFMSEAGPDEVLAAARRRLGRGPVFGAPIGERFAYSLFMAGRVARNPGLLARRLFKGSARARS